MAHGASVCIESLRTSRSNAAIWPTMKRVEIIPGFALLMLLAAALYVAIAGTVIVHGNTSNVVSAVILNDQTKHSLWRLPGGMFFGIPQFDGYVEVHCKDGSKSADGYVTGGLHSSFTVVSGHPCVIAEEV